MAQCTTFIITGLLKKMLGCSNVDKPSRCVHFFN